MRKHLIIILIPLLIQACAVVSDNVRAEKTESNDFSALQIQTVKVESKNGSIKTSVGGDDSIHAVFKKWATGADEQDAEENLKDVVIRVDEDTASGILSIDVDTPNRPGISYGCDISLSLPASLFLNLGSSNGAITVLGNQNGLECSTSNGAITIENTSGNAKLKTSNGKITIRNHYGELDSKTSNGAIDADIVLPEGGNCFLKTSNGKIVLSIPNETSAMIKASTSNGRINVADLTVNAIIMEQKEFEGEIGDGKGNIELETTNGSILIRSRL